MADREKRNTENRGEGVDIGVRAEAEFKGNKKEFAFQAYRDDSPVLKVSSLA